MKVFGFCLVSLVDQKTIKAGEAWKKLCFGLIDGQMEKIDDKTYKKYFSPRRKNSKWSQKNKHW